jgi:putative ABC transport system permease protein
MRRRSREGIGRKRLDPLWGTAPLALRRYPGVFAAILVGGTLLSLAAVSAPLFLSAATSRLLQAHVADPVITRWGAGSSYQSRTVPLDRSAPDGSGVPLHERQAEVFAERMAGSPSLAPVVRSALSPEVSVSVAGGTRSRSGRLMGRVGALDHVEALEGRRGHGVWISDLTARGVGARPGDTLELQREGGPSVLVPVDGIYRALSSVPSEGFWRAWHRDIHPLCEDCPVPPPFLLTSLEQVVDLTHDLGAPTMAIGLDAPLATDRITLEEGRALEGFLARFERDITDRGSVLHDLFRCCGFQGPPDRTRTDFVSNIGRVVDQVERRMLPVEGPVQVLLAAGLAVALAVIAGAGAFATAARRVEADLLDARGWSPWSFAPRAGLEAVLPSAGGAAAGLGLGVLLVWAVGPDAPLEGAILRRTAVTSALTVPVAAALVGAVAGWAFGRRSGTRTPRRRWVSRLPWEGAALALGGALLLRLRRSGAFVDDPELGFARPDPFLLLAPILFLAGAAGAVARAFRVAATRWRAHGPGVSHARYLAAHRLASAPAMVVLLFAGTALAVATFAYAQTVVRSMRVTVEAKAGVFVGGEAQATVGRDTRMPSDLSVPATRVTRIRDAGSVTPGGDRFDLLAVDPATLPDAAYWRDDFADASLEELAASIAGQAADGMPVVIAGSGDLDITGVTVGRRLLPASVVGRARAFPGTSSDRPLIVVADGAYREAFGPGDPFRIANASTQLWFRGDPGRARQALARVGIRPFGFLTARQVRDVPSIAAIEDTFGVLNLLSIAAGLLVLGVMVLYLQARQRAQLVAGALSARMGLTEADQRRALLGELGSLLGTATIAAVVLGLLASSVVVPLLDPLATVAPRPMVVVPFGPLVGVVAVVALGCWGGALAVARRARRAPLGEVLRVAE